MRHSKEKMVAIAKDGNACFWMLKVLYKSKMWIRQYDTWLSICLFRVLIVKQYSIRLSAHAILFDYLNTQETDTQPRII